MTKFIRKSLIALITCVLTGVIQMFGSLNFLILSVGSIIAALFVSWLSVSISTYFSQRHRGNWLEASLKEFNYLLPIILLLLFAWKFKLLAPFPFFITLWIMLSIIFFLWT